MSEDTDPPATVPSEIIRHASPNHDSREGQAIDILLLHYTGMTSGPEAITRLCDPAAKVSAHYLIEEDGRLFQLVPEERRAWHAGVAAWAGDRDINARSIGIELVNPGHEFGYRPFPEAQMARLIGLAASLVARHGIPAARVLGHSDVAPSRKQDPGEFFDWSRLAQAGIGLWPQAVSLPDRLPTAREVAGQLSRFGYDTAGNDPATVITAFQRHFQPHKVDGVADLETAALLSALLAQKAGA